MNEDIPDVDRSHVAEWALAKMYKAMRLAEKSAADYKLNKALIANSKVGARDIPTQADLDLLASNNKWYMEQVQMYSSVFVVMELADDSPHRKKYQAAIEAVSRDLAKNKIPGQRTT